MFKMLPLFLIYLLHTIYGHADNSQNDADLQAELIPQELNPEFVPAKKSPWHAVIPMTRTRRDTDVVPIAETSPISFNVKLYSRMASCIALAFAAVVEIVIYVLEFYN